MKQTGWVTAIGIVAAALALAPTAFAKDGDVRAAGTCTGASTSELKLSREHGLTEVELEVDQNRNGVAWRVVLFRNGKVVGRKIRVTRAPSGSFDARFVRRGAGTFLARATSRTGEVCTARAGI